MGSQIFIPTPSAIIDHHGAPMNDKHIVSKHHATFESIQQTDGEGNEA
jgi:hypothetical protein